MNCKCPNCGVKLISNASHCAGCLRDSNHDTPECNHGKKITEPKPVDEMLKEKFASRLGILLAAYENKTKYRMVVGRTVVEFTELDKSLERVDELTLDDINLEITRNTKRNAILIHERDLRNPATNKLDAPHWTPTDKSAKCIECGKRTNWLWNYEARCRTNGALICANNGELDFGSSLSKELLND